MFRLMFSFCSIFLFISFIFGQQKFYHDQTFSWHKFNPEVMNATQSTFRQTSLQAIIPDFQVNENGGPYFTEQAEPSVAIDKSGNFVVVWIDYRHGDPDIYGQRFAKDGTPLDDIFRINDDDGNAWQSRPCVAMDSTGNFIVIWYDIRNDINTDIYAQRYKADGTPIGKNFKINDDNSNERQTLPVIAFDGSGNFIAVWTDYRNGNSDIYAQRFLADGTTLGANFKINDNDSNSSQYDPFVAFDKSGNFIVTWTDKRNGNSDIYAQRFAADGTTLGNNFKINDDYGDHSQEKATLAIDGAGNLMVTWQDNRNGDYDIYAQMFSADGTALNTNFKVNDNNDNSWQAEPSIAVDHSGNFIIVWRDERNGSYDIYAQRFTADGATIEANFKVNDNKGNSDQQMPSIAANDSGKFVIVWQDSRNKNTDIYGQRFTADGMLLGENFKINKDLNTARQSEPALAVDAAGNFIVVWKDERNNKNEDIYLQRYASDGSPLGNNLKVNDDSVGAIQRDPAVAFDGSGNFVVAWEDFRSGYPDIYAQRFSADGTAIDVNFKVNDNENSNLTYGMQYNPSVAADASGKVMIVWVDKRNGDSDIYAQLFASDGTTLGANFKVNDDVEKNSQYDPAVAVDGTGNFIVVWVDTRDLFNDIYAQKFAPDGSPLGSNFKVNDDTVNVLQSSPSVAFDGAGNFVIVWTDEREGIGGDIYAQRYAADGSALGKNFKVNDDEGTAKQYSASVGVDKSGKFIIEWTDERNGNRDIFAQRFDSNGAKIGQNFIVTRDTKNTQESSDVKLLDGRIYSVWRSDHSEPHYDIWANVLDWNNPTAIENNFKPVITRFRLFQNYPNPFNPNTTIRYELPEANSIQLIIYNSNGEIVRKMIDKHQSSGFHQIVWDGKDDQGRLVVSGIYFYTLKAKQVVLTKKMVLLK